MSKIRFQLRKFLLVLTVAGIGLAFGPTPTAHAQAPSDAPTPAQRAQRLERIWGRQQRRLDRLELLFDRAQQHVDNAQALIDRAAGNGKDVSGVQAALDAFAAAVKAARPIFESTHGIVASHQGFDASGKVTDVSKASATVEQMAGKLREIQEALAGTLKDLREALRSFREANRPT